MTTDRTSLRRIPAGYSKITYTKPVDAVVYARIAPGTVPAAIGFSGKAGKPDFHYRFKNLEQLQTHCQKYFENRIAHNERVAKRKAERNAYEHDFKVGEILYSSWGYDQTNIDFYQVTAVPSKKTIRIRPIASMTVDETGAWAQEYVYPCRDRFTGPETLHRVYGGAVSVSSCASAWRWDYDKKLKTSYA